MFGGVMKMPENFSGVSYDLRQLSDAYCLNHDDFDANTPHQALLDARVQYNLYVKMKKHLLSLDPKVLGLQTVGGKS
jgi:DNA polymerase III epsilon subunit-like protein